MDDWFWILVKLSFILMWVGGFAILACFLIFFKPTRKLIEKVLGAEIEIF